MPFALLLLLFSFSYIIILSLVLPLIVIVIYSSIIIIIIIIIIYFFFVGGGGGRGVSGLGALELLRGPLSLLAAGRQTQARSGAVGESLMCSEDFFRVYFLFGEPFVGWFERETKTKKNILGTDPFWVSLS